mgnify:CR=1 FL=1
MDGLNLRSAVAGIVLIVVVLLVGFKDSLFSEDVEFDVMNATIQTCEGWWHAKDGPITFIDGDHVGEIFDDDPLDEYPGRPGGYGHITRVETVEIIADSPGKEVIAEIGCNGGGTMYSVQTQVFAGNSKEPKQLGALLCCALEEAGVYYHPETGRFFEALVTSQRAYGVNPYNGSSDPNCCPSGKLLMWNEWSDGEWTMEKETLMQTNWEIYGNPWIKTG